MKNRLSDRLIAQFPELKAHAESTEIMVQLASAIIQLRARRNLTQRELAKMAGIPPTLVSELENVRNPGVNVRTIAKLLRALKVSLTLDFCVSDDASCPIGVRIDSDDQESTKRVQGYIDWRNMEVFTNKMALAA